MPRLVIVKIKSSKVIFENQNQDLETHILFCFPFGLLEGK